MVYQLVRISVNQHFFGVVGRKNSGNTVRVTGTYSALAYLVTSNYSTRPKLGTIYFYHTVLDAWSKGNFPICLRLSTSRHHRVALCHAATDSCIWWNAALVWIPNNNVTWNCPYHLSPWLCVIRRAFQPSICFQNMFFWGWTNRCIVDDKKHWFWPQQNLIFAGILMPSDSM